MKQQSIKKKKKLFLFIWLGVKKWKNKKVNLYKFIYIHLLKKDAQLK